MPDQDGDHNIEELTIRDLFAVSPDNSPELAAGLEAKDFREMEKRISSLSEPVPWNRVQSEISGLISEALNGSLIEAWACAWEKYQDVKNDVEESRKSPDALVLSRLAEHSIHSTLHPYVEVFLGSNLVQKVPFDVTLATQIKGLVLGIKNGRLVSLQLVECEWSGTIAVHGAVLVERKLAKLNLPGRITLKHGISLCAPGDG
jgi:hypothetical protein